MSGLTRLLAGLLPLIILAFAERDFVDPDDETLNTEFYDYDADNRFGFYTTPVTWFEAYSLCPTAEGQLVEIIDDDMAKFIARALAESVVGYGALWTGGQYKHPNFSRSPDDTGKWIWVNSTIRIPTPDEMNITSFPMDIYPFWVDIPIMNTTDGLCLGTDRRLHHLPIIVPLPCRAKRPFICKVPTRDVNGSTPVLPPIHVAKKEFFIFQAHFTWAEANNECRRKGMTLAKIISAEEFRIVQHRMLRIRPIMENAWIAGICEDKRWFWRNDEGSRDYILTDQSRNSSKELFAWYRPDNIIYDGCLLADRHLCNEFVYVEAKCDRRRDFICEKRSKTIQDGMIDIPYSHLVISTYAATWNVSAADCMRCMVGGGEILKMDDRQVKMPLLLYDLWQAMTVVLGREIRHLWLGAHLNVTDYFWYWKSDLSKPDRKRDRIDRERINTWPDKLRNASVQFCHDDVTVDKFLLDYRCLNLDRENQLNFFMYGLRCDMKQHFICSGLRGEQGVLKEECRGMGTKPRSTVEPTTQKNPFPRP